MKVNVIDTIIEELPRKLRVCAYVRVSSEKDAQKESLENQEEYFNRKYANDDSCEFIGVFSDCGISGTSESRPSFQRMLNLCHKGGIDLIHTKSISRFARNTVTVLKVSRELKALGIGIYFEEQNINTLSGEGELMLTVLASFAQGESFNISENQKWAIRKKFARGELMINTTRFLGYDKDEDGNLIINEGEAEIVRFIFNLYLQGEGTNKIAKRLNEVGIKTLTGKLWIESTIRGMLRNEKYKGDCLLQKYFVPEVGGTTRPNKGEVQSYYIKDNHEAIIEENLWEEVQLRIKENAKKKGIDLSNTKKYVNRYPLTGILICPYCGKNLMRHHAYKNYVWACSTYIRKGKQACKGIRIPVEITETWNIKEPVVVKEVTLDGKKHYRYSGNQSDTRQSCSKGNAENKNGSLLQSVNGTRRTVIKL